MLNDSQMPAGNPYGQVISLQNAAHYNWGNNCDGWFLLKTDAINVIREKMPAGAAEQLHFHERAQQLFYILEGIASFEIEGEIIIVKANESIAISPGRKHSIANKNSDELHFLVISQPNSHGDRINILPDEKL